MPSRPVAERVKGPPEPKSRVTVQRTPKLLDGRPVAGAPVPQFSLISATQTVFFGVPEKVVFAKNCRLKVGEAQVTAATTLRAETPAGRQFQAQACADALRPLWAAARLRPPVQT